MQLVFYYNFHVINQMVQNMKFLLTINQIGFGAIMSVFGIALSIGKFLYKYALTPIMWVLWQLAKLMPEEKADPNAHAIERITNNIAYATCHVVDTYIFKTKELESEKWTREWEAKGCPAYKNSNINKQ